MSLTVYHYPTCSTCKKALRWLEARGIEHERVHIVERAPTVATLRAALRASGKPLRALFNTSGLSYRKGGFKDRLPTMGEDEALAALADDGKLIRRPLVMGDELALIGFGEDEYRARLT